MGLQAARHLALEQCASGYITCHLLSPFHAQIDNDWAGSAVGEWVSKRLGIWQRLGPFFIQLFDRHPEV